MTEQISEAIKVDLGEYGGILDFKNIDEIAEWYRAERDKYSWTQNLRVNATSQVWSFVNGKFNQLNTQINAAKQNISRNTPIKGNIDQIKNWFEENYVTNQFLLLSSTPAFKFIEAKKETDEVLAAITLGQIIGASIWTNGVEKTEFLNAAFDAYFYQKGMKEDLVQSERDSLIDLKGKWEKHLDEFTVKEENLESQFNATNENIASFFQEKTKEATEFFEKHDKELSDLKETYNQYMALKAPVDYWEEKRKHHKESVPKFRNWTIGVGIVGAIILGLSVWALLTEGKPPVWKIGGVVIVATMLIWALRILTRILLSHIHLETDAHERVTMAKTYLSLIRDESGLEDGDKKLILSTLFRPSNTGVIKDDGLPPGFYDLATKIGAK